MARDLLLTAAVVFAVNLMPAFGPPTWAVLAFLKLDLGVPAVPLVLVGATSAAAGRYTLARIARRERRRLPAERRESLEALGRRLETEPAATAGLLGVFLFSPLPSAQLFVAAGLSNVRLERLTLVFLLGRLASYGIYVTGTVVAADRFGDVLRRGLVSPWGIALQIVLLAGLVVLVRVDWPAVFDRVDARRRARAARRRTGTG